MATTKSKHILEILGDDKLTPIITGLRGTLGKLGVFVGGAAVAGAFVNATKAAIAFEQGLAKTATLLPAANRNMDAFARGLEKIRASGAGASLNDLTEGLYQTVSAGVKAGDAVKFLDTAARAAKAGFTDTKTAVDGLTGVLNAYRMEAGEAEKVADILFVTQNRGKTTFGELAASMGKILPVASNVGISFVEVAAAFQSLTLQNISTAESATGLRAILAGFIRQGDSAKLTTLGLAGALNDLQERTGGNATKIQEYLGGIEAVVPAMALMGKNAGALADNIKATANAAGTAQDAYATFTNTTQGKIDEVTGRVDVLITKLGEIPRQELLNFAITDENRQQMDLTSDAILLWAKTLAKTIEFQFVPVYLLFRGLQAAGNRGGGDSGVTGSAGSGPFGSAFDSGMSAPGTTPNIYTLREQVVIGNIVKSGDGIQQALDKVAYSIRESKILGSLYFGANETLSETMRRESGLSAEDSRVLGSMHPSGRGVRQTRSPYGDSEADRVLSGSFTDTPAGHSLGELDERIRNIAPAFQYAMQSVMDTLVQGFLTGKGQIVDVLNSLKMSILNILSQIAARYATAGLLSLIPGAGAFGAILGALGGGIFSHGGGGGGRPSPVGASSASGFGRGGHTVNFYGAVYGDAESIALRIEETLSGRMRRGTSKLLRASS